MNLSALSSVTNAAQALSNLVLVSPQKVVGYQPQPSEGTEQVPPALLFHYEGENTAQLESDITDHFVEDNTAINDQIALRPEIVTVNGFIGELNNVVPKALQPLKFIADKLTIIDAYTPSLSATALIAFNEAVFFYSLAKNAANSAISAWSSISGRGGTTVISGEGVVKEQPNQNKQQEMFQQFYAYWRSRALFTVQTPWAIFQNMAIKSLRAVQDAETRVITDFQVTFKMIRFADTITESADISNFQGRSADQAAGTTNLGTSTPPESSETFQQAFDSMGGG